MENKPRCQFCLKTKHTDDSCAKAQKERQDSLIKKLKGEKNSKVNKYHPLYLESNIWNSAIDRCIQIIKEQK